MNQDDKKVKYFGIIVASEINCYTLPKIEIGLNIHNFNTRDYVLDIGISI